MEKTERVFRETLPELLVKIESAKAVAPTNHEFDKRKKQEFALTNSFLKGKITSQEYESREAELEKLHGALEFSTLPEFSRALKAIGFPKELLEEILAHENAHMNRIEAYGITGTYLVQFYKKLTSDTKSINIHPEVSYGFPIGTTEVEKRRILKEII